MNASLLTTSADSGEKIPIQSFLFSVILLIIYWAVVWFASAPKINDTSTSSADSNCLYPFIIWALVGVVPSEPPANETVWGLSEVLV